MNQDQQIVKPNPHPADVEFPFAFPLPAVSQDGNGEAGSQAGIGVYLKVIRKHLLLILALTALCTLATAVYMARKPDIYGANARVQIDLESNPGVGATGKPLVINTPANAPDYFETQLEILRGSGLIRRVVKTLDLEHNRAFFKPQTGQRTTWQRLMGMAGIDSDTGDEQNPPAEDDVLMTAAVAPATNRENLAEIKRLNPYVQAVQGGLNVEQIGHTRLININYSHKDPHVAAKVVNAIADTFVLSNLERMTETNTSSAAFLKKRIADLQSQIRNGEERLTNYAKDNQIISLDPSQNILVERLNSLNRQLLTAENDRSLAEAAYRSALAPGAADTLAGGSGGQVNTEAKLSDLRQRLAQLRAEYTDKWPEIRLVEKQIAELQRQAEENKTQNATMAIKTLEVKLRDAQQREREVRAVFEQARNDTITQNSAAVNYRILQQEIQTNQELLNGLMQRFKENDVVLAGTPNNIRVADYANTPEYPIGPQRTRAVGLAFAFSLAFGIGLALLRELSNNTVRTTNDVSRDIHLPTVAVVPTVKGLHRAKLLSAGNLFLQSNQTSRNGRPLLMDQDVQSQLSEVYRKLRTTLMLSKPGKTPKTLLVTSSLPAEGKTTTAVNMASIMAQAGGSVLIIDADMRQPMLHEIFNLDNERGLSTLLAGKDNEAEMLSLIHEDEKSGLYVLPAGPPTERPADLLSSSQMRLLLEVAAPRFTHIVIDSTPVITFADSVLIANLVDGVILVVQGGKIPKEIVQQSRNELTDVGANVFGVVLNNVEVTSNNGYYKYYYRRSS